MSARQTHFDAGGFRTGMAHNLCPAMQTQSSHDESHDDIRPSRTGAENAQCRQYNRQIADSVIARADPDRAHVRVPTAEAVQYQGDTSIGQKRQAADQAHGFGMRQRT